MVIKLASMKQWLILKYNHLHPASALINFSRFLMQCSFQDKHFYAVIENRWEIEKKVFPKETRHQKERKNKQTIDKSRIFEISGTLLSLNNVNKQMKYVCTTHNCLYSQILNFNELSPFGIMTSCKLYFIWQISLCLQPQMLVHWLDSIMFYVP